MEIFLIILSFLLFAATLILSVLFWNGEKRAKELSAEYNELQKTYETTEEKHAGKYIELQKERESLLLEGVRLRAENQSLRDKAENDRQELEKLQASFRAEFRNLANDIMEEKSKQFKEINRESMELLLKPFRDNISDFKRRVEDIYSQENEQRGALKAEIKNLMDLNRRITEETNHLTAALKGNSKVQGDWGEVILDTILESSNLVNGIHYTTQTNLKDEAGNNRRPDVILRLPEGKEIVIDSKVSLTAFVNYTRAEETDARNRFMKEHLRSIRAHVEELGRKSYQELLNSPDFVIMFVPTEPAFLAALQSDPEIWNDAYRKKVIISSPTNLFALLKIVDDLWKRDNQSKNALRIAEEGGNLYNKFVGFVETLENIGKGISAAGAAYEKAMTQLKTGSGNLIGRTEKLRKLGVKATKSLPPALLQEKDED